MLGLQEGENIHRIFSDHLHFLHESQVLIRPKHPLEFVQIGNCGSLIETSAGWLVITHGVGLMRKYCLGAVLLGLQGPSRVIGRLREPLLRPAPDECEGYVPNVVFSCGAMIHGPNFILPYARWLRHLLPHRYRSTGLCARGVDDTDVEFRELLVGRNCRTAISVSAGFRSTAAGLTSFKNVDMWD
jgi:hypothetical protein